MNTEGLDMLRDISQNETEQMFDLALGLLAHSHDSGSKSHLDEATQLFEQALSKSSLRSSRRMDIFSNLVNIYYDSYTESGSLSDLDRSISVATEYISAIEVASQDWQESSYTLMRMCHERYYETENLDHLLEAEKWAQRLVDNFLDDSVHQADNLNSLGIILREAFYHTQDKTYLEKALEMAQKSVDVQSSDTIDSSTYFHNLAITKLEKHLCYDDLSSIDGRNNLEEAINAAEKAVELCPDESPLKPEFILDAGRLYCERFDLTEHIDDLNLAIESYRRGMRLMSEDHEHWHWGLLHLGDRLDDRYAIAGSLNDLDQSIALCRMGLDLFGEDDEEDDFPICAGYLGERLIRRYERTRSPVDIEETFEISSRALEDAPEGHWSRVMLLKNMVAYFLDRHDRFGNKESLEAGIHYAMQAVALSEGENKEVRPVAIYCLAKALAVRGSYTSSLDDLDNAILYTKEVLRETPETNEYYVEINYSLQRDTLRRFVLTRDVRDLNQAMELGKRIEMKADGAKFQAHQYFTLAGYILAQIHKITGSEEILDQRIDLSRKILDRVVALDDRSYLSRTLLDLSDALAQRYELKDKFEDLEESIEFAKKAVINMEEEGPDRARALLYVGWGLKSKFLISGIEEHRQQSLSHLRSALTHVHSNLSDRIESGTIAMSEYLTMLNWEDAYGISETLMELIPQLIIRSHKNSDKQRVLVRVHGLASEAAALALQVGKPPYIALSHLDQGSGLLAASIYGSEADMNELKLKHPSLAERFRHLQYISKEPTTSDALEDGIPESFSGLHVKRSRYEVGKEFDHLVEEIRQQRGFEGFLLFPNESELKDAAAKGPIVIVNMGSTRSDAILITQDEITFVPLPLVAWDQLNEFSTGGSKKTEPFLQWCWDCIAEPVLNTLGFKQPPSGKWPHVWWVLTGRLSNIPIHAAGHHSEGGYNTVIDRVMSSYYTSVRALVYGRKRPAPTVPGPALLLAMEHTPGYQSLPFTSQEVDVVKKLLDSFSIETIESGPDKESVMANLPLCKIFHWAGHGSTSHGDPMESCLILHQHTEKCLTVANLLETNLYSSNPFLAYLSACGTGQLHNQNLGDEGIHLINGFLLSGFRHVIGTLWEVQDEICVDVARMTYEGIRENGMADDNSPSSVIILPSLSTPSSENTPEVSSSTPDSTSSAPATLQSSTTTPSAASTPELSETPGASTTALSDISAVFSTPTTLETSTTPSPSIAFSSSATPTPSSSSSSSSVIPQPTGWALQSTGTGTANAGSFLRINTLTPQSLVLFSPTDVVPSSYKVANFYIDPSTGYLFLDYEGVKDRYVAVTTYDEFNENGEYWQSINTGELMLWDMTMGEPTWVSLSHIKRITCSRTGATFGCTASAPVGVFNTFSYNPTYFSLNFGTTVPQGSQLLTFAAVDVY
ncbi:unnamed protein product [Clonostachys byssicola]|uniref:CHAT domain-containing protein n=1 Tax=Clonostachys byssicola TaxID=160290 RepID=A0A9N9USY5_9HYPO|nr:unnamed protein product [Clonostachys byssicola]